jgi:hypothetical protein
MADQDQRNAQARSFAAFVIDDPLPAKLRLCLETTGDVGEEGAVSSPMGPRPERYFHQCVSVLRKIAPRVPTWMLIHSVARAIIVSQITGHFIAISATA